MLDIVAATFGTSVLMANARSDTCEAPEDDIHELACEWHHINTRGIAMLGDEQVLLEPTWVQATSQVSLPIAT